MTTEELRDFISEQFKASNISLAAYELAVMKRFDEINGRLRTVESCSAGHSAQLKGMWAVIGLVIALLIAQLFGVKI